MRKYRQRIHYTETDKALMWDRWRKGDSLETIARLFDRSHGSVARILRRTGGIRPPKRTRSRRTLSLAEREEISRGVVAGRSLRSIAASLKRAPSTVSREINHNGGRQHYRVTRTSKVRINTHKQRWDLPNRLPNSIRLQVVFGHSQQLDRIGQSMWKSHRLLVRN